MHRTLLVVPSAVYTGLLVVLLVCACALLVLYVQDHEALAVQLQQNEQLHTVISQAQVQLDDAQHRVAQLREQLDVHKQLLASARQEANATSTSVAKLNEAVASVSQTATYLTKLKETDEELLAKYSKVYFLNEHYVPRMLASIPVEFTAGKNMQFHAQAISFLQDLFIQARAEGLSLQTASAYRSFSYQSDLKGRYIQQYGTGANTFSADQGYSEHQLGTAIDFSTSVLGGGLSGFEETPEYRWLTEHAHEYGFILSYPQNNVFYEFEPWHWRFVGIGLATELHNKGMYFYDMPQRDIDAYRASIFD